MTQRERYLLNKEDRLIKAKQYRDSHKSEIQTWRNNPEAVKSVNASGNRSKR